MRVMHSRAPIELSNIPVIYWSKDDLTFSRARLYKEEESISKVPPPRHGHVPKGVGYLFIDCTQ